MPVSASIVLDTRRKASKGYPIKIRVRPKYIPLNEYAEKEHWDNANVTKDHPEYRRLHLKLQRRALALVDELNYCNDNNLDFDTAFMVIKNGLQDTDTEIFALKQKIKTLQTQTGIGFLAFFDVRMNEKRRIKESVSHYQLTKARLVSYLGEGNDVSINEVTYDWLIEFRNYKLSSGTEKGGVNSYLETMRAGFNEAQKRPSLNIKSGNPFKGIIKGGKKREIVELEKKELKLLMGYNPELSPTKTAARKQIRNVQIWLFQLLLGGHDYVDIALLKWSDIKKNRIRFKRYKNRNKVDGGALVDNLLLPAALRIIDKYGDTAAARIFDFIPDPASEPERYNEYRKNVNRSLNTVKTKLGLGDKVRTKSTRYLFRSKAGELLVHDLIISQLQGHKMTGVSYNYQKKLPHKVIDKEYKRIVKALLGKKIVC